MRYNMLEYEIKENRIKHILGVARRCYEIAKKEQFDEDFCQKMYLLGWIHDVGYDFEPHNHEQASAKLLGMFTNDDTALEALKYHDEWGMKPRSAEHRILMMADMTTDSQGNKVTIEQRLEDVARRFGKESETYKKAYKATRQWVE